MWSGHRGGNERPTDADAKFWACARWPQIGSRGYFMGLSSTDKITIQNLTWSDRRSGGGGGGERERAFWAMRVGDTIGREAA